MNNIMNNEEILKLAIEKAVKNGYTDWGWQEGACLGGRADRDKEYIPREWDHDLRI